MHKYILVTGAPGSRWSGVVKNIYYSKDVDRSDYTDDRIYSENGNTLHTGAYWDPGMEFDIHEWDAPFHRERSKNYKITYVCSRAVLDLKS